MLKLLVDLQDKINAAKSDQDREVLSAQHKKLETFFDALLSQKYANREDEFLQQWLDLNAFKLHYASAAVDKEIASTISPWTSC